MGTEPGDPIPRRDRGPQHQEDKSIDFLEHAISRLSPAIPARHRLGRAVRHSGCSAWTAADCLITACCDRGPFFSEIHLRFLRRSASYSNSGRCIRLGGEYQLLSIDLPLGVVDGEVGRPESSHAATRLVTWNARRRSHDMY